MHVRISVQPIILALQLGDRLDWIPNVDTLWAVLDSLVTVAERRTLEKLLCILNHEHHHYTSHSLKACVQ